MERRDVLVLGAGLAGLSCARDLALGGADVLLLEARDRPGGRVEQALIGDGRVAQMGGEIVGPVHHAYLGLARELRLPIVGSYTEEPGEIAYDLFDGVEIGEAWLDDADRAALARYEQELESIARSLDPADPWSHPDAGRLDRLSELDLLNALGATPAAIRVVLMHHLGAAAGPIHRWSVLASARAAAAAGGRSQFDYETWESLKVDGGSARLPLALADELGDRLRLGAVVRAIRAGSPCGVELEGGERLEADAVVCAMPVGPLRALRIDGLSDERLASLHRQRQVLASKAVTALADPAWRRVGWNGLAASERDIGGFWVQGESTLSTLMGPEQFAFVQAAPPGVATAAVTAALERIMGEPVEPITVEWRHWGADPFTLGYVSHWAPGDLLAVGPLHGTHEPPFYLAGSDHWACGYMEGAVATGRAAAAAALGAEVPDLYPARPPA